MTKFEFRQLFVKNLIALLPDDDNMYLVDFRMASKGEKNLYTDTETMSVRPIHYQDRKYVLTVRPVLHGIWDIMMDAMYKTLDVKF